MKCNFCKTYQKVSSSCNNPDCYKFNTSHKYFCNICNLWMNNKDKHLVILDSILINNINTNTQIYHCKDCGICRMGIKDNYKHCSKCNSCYHKKSLDNHNCIGNLKEENCPICMKDIWGAFRDSSQLLKCGHSVHSKCFIESLKNQNFNCPLCKKSMVDLTDHWKMIDLFLSNQTMPEEFINDKSEIYCNDCEKKSTVNFHFIYHKCLTCNGYNTVVDKVIKHNPEESV
jgi:RING finger/CHY zinc finger protein 1